jgi:preprotein translocase subunit SecD
MQTLKTMGCLALITACFAGCSTTSSTGKNGKKAEDEVTLRIHEEANSSLPTETFRTVEIPHTGVKLTVDIFPALTERDVQSAELYDTAGGKAIFVRFDPQGTVMLDQITTRDRGQYLMIFLNNHPVGTWFVDQRITNGQFLVEGDFTDEAAGKAVEALNKLSKKNSKP